MHEWWWGFTHMRCLRLFPDTAPPKGKMPKTPTLAQLRDKSFVPDLDDYEAEFVRPELMKVPDPPFRSEWSEARPEKVQKNDQASFKPMSFLRAAMSYLRRAASGNHPAGRVQPRPGILRPL